MITATMPRFVRIGPGTAEQVPEILRLLGSSRPLLVVDPHFRDSPLIRDVSSALEAAGCTAGFFFGVVPEPTTASAEEAARLARTQRADAVIAIGGGSAIDTGKAAALRALHDVSFRALRAPYRVVERGLPLIAVPTTAGTGSEATRFCLITDSETGDKMVCIGEGFMPTAAVVDPAMTLSVPRRLTAETGIDAFTHALEAFVGRKANTVSNIYAEKALVLIAKSLPALMDDVSDEQARADMMLGSFLAGSAFSNSGLGLAHAMSAPLGALFHVPHGLSVGLLLPAVTRFSIARAPAPYARVARLLGISDQASDPAAAAEFMSWLDRLNAKLSLSTLASRGVERSGFERAISTMAQDAPASGAAANNPAVPDHQDIEALFRETWA